MDNYSNDYDLPVWERPDYYGGFSPDGDFVLATQNRDSDVLERSNYRCFLEKMQSVEEKHSSPIDEGDYDQSGTWVYEFRASHWAVGWVEYLLLRRDAPEDLQEFAAEILGDIQNYPVLDEDDFYHAQEEEAESAWDGWLGDQEKVYLLKKHGISIFAMRRDFSEIATPGLIQDIAGS